MSSSQNEDPHHPRSRALDQHRQQVYYSQFNELKDNVPYHWRIDAHRIMRQLVFELNPFTQFQRASVPDLAGQHGYVLDTRMPWTFDDPVKIKGDALRRKVSDESPDESLFRHNERDRECHLIVAHGALWERDYGEEDRSWAKHAHASHARLPFLSERHGSGPSVFVVKNRGDGPGGRYSQVKWSRRGLFKDVSLSSNGQQVHWPIATLWEIDVILEHAHHDESLGARFFGGDRDNGKVFFLFVPMTQMERKAEREFFNHHFLSSAKSNITKRISEQKSGTIHRIKDRATGVFSSSSSSRPKEEMSAQDLTTLAHVWKWDMEYKTEVVELVTALLKAIDVDGIADVAGVDRRRPWKVNWGTYPLKGHIVVTNARIVRARPLQASDPAALGLEYTLPVGELKKPDEDPKIYDLIVGDVPISVNFWGWTQKVMDWNDHWEWRDRHPYALGARPLAMWQVVGSIKNMKKKLNYISFVEDAQP